MSYSYLLLEKHPFIHLDSLSLHAVGYIVAKSSFSATNSFNSALSMYGMNFFVAGLFMVTSSISIMPLSVNLEDSMLAVCL